MATHDDHEKTETISVKARVVRPEGSRLRRLLLVLLVVICCLGVVVSSVAGWAHYTVLNTDGYIKMIGPVGKNPKAIRGLSDYVAGQVITATDLQTRTADALPSKAQFLAAPITDAVDKFISDQTVKVLSTPTAYKLWIGVNRVAHQKIVGLLRGQNTYTYIQGSDVKLNIIPIISQVLVWIDGKLPGWLSTKFSPPTISPDTPPAEASQQLSQWLGRPLPADFGQITLLKSDSLGPAQTAVKWFDRLVIVLPIVTLLLMAVTVWLSRRRLRTLIELGIGSAVALIVAWVIINRGQQAVVNGLNPGTTLDVVREVANAAVDPLRTITVWLVVVGVVVAFLAWIIGRKDVRETVVRVTVQVAQAGADKTKERAPVAAWIARYGDLLRIVGLVVGLVLLLVLSSSWTWVIVLLVLIVAFELLVSWAAGDWPFERRPQADGAA